MGKKERKKQETNEGNDNEKRTFNFLWCFILCACSIRFRVCVHIGSVQDTFVTADILTCHHRVLLAALTMVQGRQCTVGLSDL